MIRLPRLPAGIEIVDTARVASTLFARWWQEVIEQIEASIGAIQTALAAAIAAQATADAAQDDAIAAATAAAAAATTAADAATAALAAQATANAALTPAQGDLVYVQRGLGPAWAAPTGTASRSTFATYAAPVISNPPTQAEVQAVADATQANSQRLKALIDDLQANGALT